MKRGRKEQHAGPVLSDGWPREERGLNQIILVTLAHLLPSTFQHWQRREEGMDGRRRTGTDRGRQRDTI